MRTKAILDAGFPVEEMLRNARTVGMATARVAEANRDLVIRNLTSPGDTERDVADRLAQTVEFLLPMGTEFLVYAFQANLLEQVKRDVIGAADLESGEFGGAVERTVCFADLVEFTSLGEEIATEELGVVVGHFEELAQSVVSSPVRLVKTIGDAVMLVSAGGRAAGRAGARPGRRRGRRRRPVPGAPRRASRPGRPCRSRATTTAARSTWRAASPASPAPAASSSTPPTREAAGEGGFDYSFAGERRLKGIDARQKLFRVRREGDRRPRRVSAAVRACAPHRAPAAPLARPRTRSRWWRSTPTPR